MPKKILTFFLILGTFAASFFSFLPSISPAKAGPVNAWIESIDFGLLACDAAWLTSGIPIIGGNAQILTLEKQWYNQSFCQFYTKVFDQDNPEEIFGERYTYAQINWIQNTLSAIPYQMFSNLVIAYAKTVVPEIAIKNPEYPEYRLSLITEVYDTLGKFSLVTPAYAQDGGFGFTTSQGLKSLWGASRNMSLILSSVIVIILGFMVMFRVKINPQTAVSVQLAIPRIALTLIGIIFSYAVAGFVIDLVYYVLGFVIFFLPSEIFVNPSNRIAAFNFFTTSDFFGLLIYFLSGSASLLLVANIISPILGIIVGLLMLIVIGRIFWKLTTTYFTFILAIVTGPWQILFGMLPAPGGGYVGGFGKWFKTLFAHGAVFVIIPLMMIVNLIFWNTQGITNLAGDILERLGPIIGIAPGIRAILINEFPSVPLFTPNGTVMGSIFSLVLGLAALAMAPKLADQVKEKISGSKDTYASAVGEALSAAAGAYAMYEKERRDRGRPPTDLINPMLKRGFNTARQAASGTTPTKPGNLNQSST